MAKALPHSADLRKHRFSEPGAAYLVTKCRASDLPFPLTRSGAAEAIARSIRWHQERRYADLLAFVVMPDHIHWAFVLDGRRSLAEIVKGFASVTSRDIQVAMGSRCPAVWQEEFHDRALRQLEQTWRTVDYVHDNPVRKALCEDATEWPWSTAHRRFQHWIEAEYLH